MTILDNPKEELRRLLTEQPFGALATNNSKSPYVNLVAFSVTDDLGGILFSTLRSTRKYENLCDTGSAALLIDNRIKHSNELHLIAAATALGGVKELHGEEEAKGKKLHMSRHPYLSDFIGSAEVALMYISVSTYILVRNFQQVVTIKIK